MHAFPPLPARPPARPPACPACPQAGRVKVLFVSPERLGNPHLLEALGPHMPLPLVGALRALHALHALCGQPALALYCRGGVPRRTRGSGTRRLRHMLPLQCC